MTAVENRNELLADVSVKVERLALEYGNSPAHAESLGNAVADLLASDWGGQVISMPKDYYYRLSLVDAEIYEAWRHGATLGALAKKYNLHTRTVRNIIDRVKARIARQKKNDQGDIFE